MAQDGLYVHQSVGAFGIGIEDDIGHRLLQGQVQTHGQALAQLHVVGDGSHEVGQLGNLLDIIVQQKVPLRLLGIRSAQVVDKEHGKVVALGGIPHKVGHGRFEGLKMVLRGTAGVQHGLCTLQAKLLGLGILGLGEAVGKQEHGIVVLQVHLLLGKGIPGHHAQREIGICRQRTDGIGARALINLTGVKKGGTVLDPFCGTGGIVIEAGFMGMKAIASDFDPEMIAGTEENMDYYGLKMYDSEVLDISDIAERFGEVDAIATDPPYGRSTHTGGEDIESIYRRAMNSFGDTLKTGACAGVVLPHPIDDNRLKLQSMFVQRVHGSLSRHYHIFKKTE